MIRRFILSTAFFFVTIIPLVAQSTVPETYGDAMRWYRNEAAKGYAPAQFLLAYMLEVGVEIPEDNVRIDRDLVRARDWYAKAAAQGHARAMYRLARMYRDGRGGSVDAAEAARLFKAAAERGHVEAQSMLGYLYAMGESVERDDIQAYLWLSLAARAGDATAADNLARLLPDLSADQLSAGKALVEGWSAKQ